MSRKKQAALPVPASLEEARELTGEYVQDERGALRVRLHYEQAIDRLKAERDALLAGIADAQKPRFAALKAWWEAGGKALAGKRRSAELGGATLGVRLTTPAVKFARGVSAEQIVNWLGRVVGGKAYLRTKIELDKQAVIKAVQEDWPMAGPLGEQGLKVVQTDEFFIDCRIDDEAKSAVVPE